MRLCPSGLYSQCLRKSTQYVSAPLGTRPPALTSSANGSRGVFFHYKILMMYSVGSRKILLGNNHLTIIRSHNLCPQTPGFIVSLDRRRNEMIELHDVYRALLAQVKGLTTVPSR